MKSIDRTNKWALADAIRHLEDGDIDAFFEYVDDGVEWIVMGSHLLAGTYHGKEAFRTGMFVPINRDLQDGAAVWVRHQLIDGNRAVIELETVPTDFTESRVSHCYCWVMELNEGLITHVRAYVDAALIQEMMPA